MDFERRWLRKKTTAAGTTKDLRRVAPPSQDRVQITWFERDITGSRHHWMTRNVLVSQRSNGLPNAFDESTTATPPAKNHWAQISKGTFQNNSATRILLQALTGYVFNGPEIGFSRRRIRRKKSPTFPIASDTRHNSSTMSKVSKKMTQIQRGKKRALYGCENSKWWPSST